MAKGFVEIDAEACKGCNLCVVECPTDTLSLSEAINQRGTTYAIDAQNACIGCSNCALVCPDSCITVYKYNNKKKNT